MIKGCKKNVVWIRNTGNDMFDEAYIILSDKGAERKMSESDIVRAASRIVENSPVATYFGGEDTHEKKKERRSVKKALWFMLGATVMAALNTALLFIL